jgi:hydroxyacylglutathione hydrolase
LRTCPSHQYRPIIRHHASKSNTKLQKRPTFISGWCPIAIFLDCGHEYTASNLKFAAHIEPTNTTIAQKLAWAQSTPITVPSTIGDEKAINPFMRVSNADVVKAALGEGVKEADPVAVMGKLREMKNNF